MKLPNGERAVVDPRKLLGYSLDPEHDEGQHKAHLFESLLGVNRQNAQLLLEAVEKAAVSGDAVIGKLDKYGRSAVRDRLRIHGPRRHEDDTHRMDRPHGREFPSIGHVLYTVGRGDL